MKPISLVLAALILLSLGACSSMAQYYDGYGEEYEEGYTCWVCPLCGFVVQLDVPVDESAIEYQTTLGEVVDLDPYDSDYYCPYCGVFGAFFVLVPCSEYYEVEEDYEDYEDVEYEGEECEEGEEYEETEYVETGDECEEDAEEIGENETEVTAEPVIGDDETPDFTEPAISDLDQNLTDGANISEEISGPEATEIPPEEAGKILIVLSSTDFNDIEYNTSKARFLDEGFEVHVASKGTDEAVGMDGSSVAIDLEVADAEVSDYEAVVFIGGPGVDDLVLYEDPDYLNLASSIRDQDVIVGAICVAPKILANAWLLGGRKATVFPDSDSIAYIKSKGATYSDEQVVRDGNIITACGPEASEPFAEAVVAAVKENQA
ncbi:MAG TPA: DJ-1/PfpI family protein [Methanotrichaceae archaeon]|nr:DJ-1/PfpI family protein [Methanotrichaceae archaeon]